MGLGFAAMLLKLHSSLGSNILRIRSRFPFNRAGDLGTGKILCFIAKSVYLQTVRHLSLLCCSAVGLVVLGNCGSLLSSPILYFCNSRDIFPPCCPTSVFRAATLALSECFQKGILFSWSTLSQPLGYCHCTLHEDSVRKNWNWGKLALWLGLLGILIYHCSPLKSFRNFHSELS